MEKFYIEDKNKSDITKELKNDFKNFEDRKKGYDEELHDLGKTHLKQYQTKIDNAIKKIENTQTIDKQKYSEKYQELKNKFTNAQQEIYNKTIKLDLGWRAYKRHHDEHLNTIGATIDAYENGAINTIESLIDAINDDNQIQTEKGNVDNANKQRKYVEIDNNGIYKLTKHTNKPKIHEVLGTVLKEGELRKIDYSFCTNQYIKNKMATAISSNSSYTQASSNRFSCYLQYDSQKNTYVISDGNGNILPQRALIREGVQLTPPSKIKGEAKLAKIEQQKAVETEANRTKLTDQEKQDLISAMPKKLKETIPNEYFDEFFSKTENDINERIKEAKYLGYELAATPISKAGHTKNGRLLEIHLINGQAETKKDLITSELSIPLFKVLDSHETELVQYMTTRVTTKRGKFDYLTKRDSVTTHRENDESGEITKEKKDFSVYGLGLLQQWVDNTINKIGDTNNKNDRKFVALKKYIDDSIYALEKSDKITENDLKDIHKKLYELIPININDKDKLLLNILGMNTKWSELEKYGDGEKQKQYDNLRNSAKSKAIDSIRKIGDSRTLFDNAETTFLRDEIISNVDETNIDIENNDYEKCFKKIYELYSLPEPNLTEGEEFDVENTIKRKQAKIDELYENARQSEEKFLKFLQDKGLLPHNANDNKIKEKVKELKLTLNQKENAANSFKITGNELKNRFKSEQTDLQLKSSLTHAEKERLNQLDFILAQEDNFFDNIAKEETERTRETIKYVGIEATLKSKIAPYLIQKGGGIKGINNFDIYNDSVGAGGLFDRTDENCAKIGPVLKDIIVEVVITAVSIALSWNGAGEAIYGAFRAAKLVAQTAKGIQKILKFMAAFAKSLAKRMATQYAGKFAVRSAEAAKVIGSASKIVKGGETFGSIVGKLAMKGTSMVIEGTTFHISNTIIHNAISGNRLSEGLDPSGYTEGPDGEKIPNRRNYAQSIAFLGVLKTIGQPIGNLSGKAAKGFLKTKYPASTAEKMLSNTLSMTGEMSSMMLTDQILSLTFDQKFKAITAEDLITMFGMVAGLRLTNKVNMKFQQYDSKGVNIEMKQGENTYNVRIDREGNVLKIDGKDSTGKKIANPEQELGIKSRDGQTTQNLRQRHEGKEVGTVKGNIKQLDNLHEGDIITVKHGENNVKFKKNKNGNWEIVDSGNITNERFNVGEEYIAKENSDGSGYHLESKTEGGPKISLNGKVDVKLGTHIRIYNEYTYESSLSEKDQIKLAEQFDNNLTGKGINIDGNTYTMKIDGYIYTMYKNGKEIARGKGELIKANSDANVNFLETYNKIRTEFFISEEINLKLFNKFSEEVMSENGITINGVNYKLQYSTNDTNGLTGHKGVFKFIETPLNGKPRIYKVHSDRPVIPEDGSDSSTVRSKFNAAREKYVKNNFKSEFEKSKSQIKKTQIEAQIDFRELTESGRYQIEMENIENQLDTDLKNFTLGKDKQLNFKQFLESSLKSSQFIEGIHEWFKKITLKPDVKIPKEFLKDLKRNIQEILNKRGNKLSEYHKELANRLNNLLDSKLSKNGHEIEEGYQRKNYSDGREEIGIFDNLGKLSEGIKIIREGPMKIEFIGDIKGDFIKQQINKLRTEIKSNGKAEVMLPNGDHLEIKVKLGEFFEYITTYKRIGIIDLGEHIKIANDQLKNLEKQIEHYEKIGINVTKENKRELSSLNLTEKNFTLLERLQKIGLKINLDSITEYSQLTEPEITNIEKTKPLLKSLQIYVTELNIKNLSQFTEIEINKIIKINKTFGKILITEFNIKDLVTLTNTQISNLLKINNILGIEITDSNFKNYSKYTETEINKIIEINKLGISIKDIFKSSDILDRISLLTDNDINNLKSIQGELESMKIYIHIGNFDIVSKITQSDIVNFKKIKPMLDDLGIHIYSIDIKKRASLNLTEAEIKNIKNAKPKLNKMGVNIKSPEEFSIILDILSTNKSNAKEYIGRKNTFLKENRVLSDELFNKLFKDGINGGKYGIQNINQTDLGYCYAYTGFELLKKSNFFDVLIKTSMKKTRTGREIKLPLGDRNGHIIKVNKNEIDKKYTLKYEEKGETIERPVSINSDSSLGFKILEIAFIKEYTISNSEYNNSHTMQARTEYKNTGDITITPELLHMLESGRSTTFLEYMLPKNIVNNYHSLEDRDMQQSLLKYVNNGNIKISPRRDGYINFTPVKIENGHYENGTIEIYGSHAYSIERTYIDEITHENIVVIVNPHNTAEKIHIKAEDCSELFPTRRVSTININNLFK